LVTATALLANYSPESRACQYPTGQLAVWRRASLCFRCPAYFFRCASYAAAQHFNKTTAFFEGQQSRDIKAVSLISEEV
jgi:hypothetical protein